MEKMPDQPAESRSFEYEAQTADGAALSGVITAADGEQAQWRLAAMGLRVLRIGPVKEKSPVRIGAIKPAEFRMVHQQLASLTSAGLPLERGLRLMGRELRSSKLAATLDAIAWELEAGRPLHEAFEKHAGQLPAGYGQLIQAGVQCGNLPGMLLGLSQHMDLVQRLRQTLWRAAGYPLAVLAGAAAVLTFIGLKITPVIRQALVEGNFHVERLPSISRRVFALAESMPVLLAVGAGLMIVAAATVIWMRRSAQGRAHLERALLRIPLVNNVIRCLLLARWCDAMRLAIEAKLDLPAAMELAGRAADSPALIADASGLTVAHQVGQPLGQVAHLQVVTPLVICSFETAMAGGDLPSMLVTLRDLYRAQTEHRLSLLAALLKPASLIALGLLLAVVMTGLFKPLITLIQSFSGESA